jgi:small-conductance mechanosensitive channel
MFLFAQVSEVADRASNAAEGATEGVVAWGVHLQDSIVQSLTEMATKVAGFVPNLLGMLVILVVGYIVSKLLQRAATAILRRLRFDVASEKTGLEETMQKVGIKISASQVVGKLVFWLFMLTFLISAADALGLDNVSRTIDSFVAYLPNVIGAAVIVVVGLMLANFVRTLVAGGASRIGLEYGKSLSNLVYGVLLVVIGSLAVSQLQLETALLNRVIEIVLVATGAALAIAVGLGSRDVARHIISGVYARDVFQHGSKITIGDIEGTVEKVGTVNTDIAAQGGVILHVPNGQLFDTMVRQQG